MAPNLAEAVIRDLLDPSQWARDMEHNGLGALEEQVAAGLRLP